jgi:hypothetical protein
MFEIGLISIGIGLCGHYNHGGSLALPIITDDFGETLR